MNWFPEFDKLDQPWRGIVTGVGVLLVALFLVLFFLLAFDVGQPYGFG